jgi:hypothetical protein
MAHTQNRRNNVQHKSSADLKEKYINSVKIKLGGEGESLKISEAWETLKGVEHIDARY